MSTKMITANNPDDLSLIKSDSLREFFHSLDAKHISGKSCDKELIIAIGTGGTIAMEIKDGIRRPDLNVDTLLQQDDPHLADKFDVIGFDAFSIDSSQMNYAHVRDLVIALSYIWQQTSSEIAGFVILHGTDTMAYSAATLSLMMGQGLPFSVVFTGAQKSIQEPMNDAALNLRNALYLLESLQTHNMAEIVISVGDRAILGTSAVKITDTLANAFDAPLHKYVTKFSSLEYPVRLASWLKPKRTQDFIPQAWTHDYSQTLIIHSSLGLSPERVQAQIMDQSVKAVLLFSYGAGTVDDTITKALISAAQTRDLPVFVVSPVNTDYKIAYESGKKLIESGVIPLTMTLPSALAKIELALGLFGDNNAAMTDFMTTNYVGEIPDDHTRFSPILER